MKIISTTILVLLLVTIVVPVGYLAWRADQPMELPQFKGYTYYQYLNWRKDALHQMAVEYQASHPNAKMGGGLDMCYQRGYHRFTWTYSATCWFLHPGRCLSRIWRSMSRREIGKYIPQGCNTLDFPARLVENLRMLVLVFGSTHCRYFRDILPVGTYHHQHRHRLILDRILNTHKISA